MILREFGLNLGLISDEAENGKIAYKMYCDQIEKQCWSGYDLILMDLNMPVLSGMRATEKIKKVPAKLPPIIIAITAFDSDEEREKWRQAGFNGFNTKPIDSITFSKIINDLVPNYH